MWIYDSSLMFFETKMIYQINLSIMYIIKCNLFVLYGPILSYLPADSKC